MINPRHPANTAETVRALIGDQHPDLAGLAVGAEFVGADMVMYPLGDELAVRLPRSQNTVASLEAEAHWLGQVSANWTFPFPRVMRRGEPGHGYPFPWSVITWVPGTAAEERPLDARAGVALGAALAQVHASAPADAPFNSEQSIDLVGREPKFEHALGFLNHHPGPNGQRCDARAVRTVWEEALTAPAPDELVWSHADLHVANLISVDGAFGGIVDWADMSGCDRAVDLGFLYGALPAEGVALALAEYARLTGAMNDALAARARGIGLVMCLAGAGNGPGVIRDVNWRGLETLGVVRS